MRIIKHGHPAIEDISNCLYLPTVRELQQWINNRDISAFINVPFPLAYHARKACLPVYGRISEFEPACLLFDRFLIDPLVSWGTQKYKDLIETTQLNHRLLIMMPSTHGHSLDLDIEVTQLCIGDSRIEGLITKHPGELSGYSP
ncbi:hypothetical protein E4G67_00085 [Candidatus Bathyarchaeota archaeon]|nr:MAG: hypothetical protein E4G67_00085 [Candidatus Bathyarchaeota archaeon]